MAGADISDEMIQMAESILSLPDDVVRTMPPPLLEQIQHLLDENLLPDELAELLREKLGL